MKIIFVVLLILLTSINTINANEDWELVLNSAENCIIALETFDNHIYAGSGSNGKIYRSSNGFDWELMINSEEAYIFSLKNYNGYIYAGTGSSGKIYRSSNGFDWDIVFDSEETNINSLESFNNYIYAGTSNNGKIYRSSNGFDWELVFDSNESIIYCLKSINNYIFAGTSYNSHIYRSSNGFDWKYIDSIEGTPTSFIKFNNYIYTGTMGGEGFIYKSNNDGITWNKLNKFYVADQGLYFLELYNNYLYAGFGDEGGKLYRSSDGSNWEFIFDLIIYDIYTINCFNIYNEKAYIGTTDGDGDILSAIFRNIPQIQISYPQDNITTLIQYASIDNPIYHEYEGHNIFEKNLTAITIKNKIKSDTNIFESPHTIIPKIFSLFTILIFAYLGIQIIKRIKRLY